VPQVPRLPRETMPRRHRQPSAPKRAPMRAPPEPAQCRKCHALQRKTKADVTRHVCHAKPRWMSPSAMPATQSTAASPATKRAHSAQPQPIAGLKLAPKPDLKPRKGDL